MNFFIFLLSLRQKNHNTNNNCNNKTKKQINKRYIISIHKRHWLERERGKKKEQAEERINHEQISNKHENRE